MVAIASKPDEHFRKSVALLIQLHGLMRDGKSETSEADAIRDQLDFPWKHLTDTEARRVRDLSADLASIEPDSPFKHPNGGGILSSKIADQIQSARQANRCEEILFILREHSKDVSADRAAFLRGWCYEQLGESEVARLFFAFAAHLDRKNDLYAVFSAPA
ncbi:MAG: hypothetical protein WD851_15710 [Pirellulales bacterium]